MNKKRILGLTLITASFAIVSFNSIFNFTGSVIQSSLLNIIPLKDLFVALGLFLVGGFLVFGESLEARVPERIPEGTFYAGVPGLNYRNYKFGAYAGPNVVYQGRKEHQIDGRNHITIQSPNLKRELRIDVDTLREVDGQKIPKDLRKYLREHQTEIKRKVEAYYNTGSFA